MVNTETTEEFVKELDLTEEEIESYTGCSERTQRCLTDCPWPFGHADEKLDCVMPDML